MDVTATGNRAWAPSSSTLPSQFGSYEVDFGDKNNDFVEINEDSPTTEQLDVWLDDDAIMERPMKRGHPVRCYELFRIKKHALMKLCKVLEERYDLEATREIGVHEQMAMFLNDTWTWKNNRIIQERFQHSGETVGIVIATMTLHNFIPQEHVFYEDFQNFATEDSLSPEGINENKHGQFQTSNDDNEMSIIHGGIVEDLYHH
ncbi:hypothetical protein ACH5RR_030252 [Cinchona calisaya]|uniref:DUF8040 domain-containing protein n=1 Tax=Cinchona calisaya TaxID=153742 RepID=A0ABD2YW96_9GENT